MPTLFIDRLNISRPLIFLCGPYTDPARSDTRDRRIILEKWINANWHQEGQKTSGNKIHAFPIIVDDILARDSIKSKNLESNLAEEILAQVAYRTYIFLDTMSTSYEFGEFTNYALGENSVRVFLDSEFESRINCPINEYLKASVLSRLTTYKAEYNGKGHIFFLNDTVPKEIIATISQDNPLAPSYQSSFGVVFTHLLNIQSLEFGVFAFKQTDRGFEFFANPKTWFYYMALVQKRYYYLDISSISSHNDPIFIDFLKKVKEELFLSFCGSDKSENKSRMLLNGLGISLKCPLFGDSFFYHCVVLLGLIKHSTSGGGGSVSYVSILPDQSSLIEINDLSIFAPRLRGFARTSERRKEIIKNGVASKTLVIKGKKRNIICYSPDKYGRDFRTLHETIVREFLSYLPTSPYSFAYKEGLNTFQCLKAHEGNIHFAKFDISHYFESITLNATLNKIIAIMNTKQRREDLFLRSFSASGFGKALKALLKPLFFNGHLPIGYASSPKISDFYLCSIDQEMGKLDGVTYTRYADDILLSSKDPGLLEFACRMLNEKLQLEGLNINKEKTIKKSLMHIGDSIKFLGINLIRREWGYSYSVSRRYLIQTSKQVQRTLRAGEKEKLKIRGRISYIRFISHDSYEKLRRLIKNKLGSIPPNLGL